MMKYYLYIIISVVFLNGCATTSQSKQTVRRVDNKNQPSLLARVTTYWARGKGSDHDTRRHNASTGYGKLKKGHCAVDPKKIKYFSKIIYPDGTVDEAVDTGTDVINRKAARRAGKTLEEKKAIVIDKFFETRAQALEWARNHPLFVSVKIVPPYGNIE